MASGIVNMLPLESIISYTVDMLLRILRVLEERFPSAFDGDAVRFSRDQTPLPLPRPHLPPRTYVYVCEREKKNVSPPTLDISQTTSLSLRRYFVKRFAPPGLIEFNEMRPSREFAFL